MHKQTACLAIGVIFILLSACTGMAGSKVGYIDLKRLVQESTLGKAAMADIDRLRKDKQKPIAELLKTINNIKIDLQANEELFDNEEKREKVEELNDLTKEYKRMVADAKEDIQKQDRDLVAQILKKADGIVKMVAQKNKYTIILKDPQAIGYLDPSVDITDEVLAELNKTS